MQIACAGAPLKAAMLAEGRLQPVLIPPCYLAVLPAGPLKDRFGPHVGLQIRQPVRPGELTIWTQSAVSRRNTHR